MKNLAKPLGVAVLMVSTATSATGWYLAAHRGASAHFDSCREQPDGTVILGYAYGVGDKVTASFQPTKEALVVSLLVDSNFETRPAIAVRGELRIDTSGGLQGRPVKHEDGTVLPCASVDA
jgi:hypothetical protein